MPTRTRRPRFVFSRFARSVASAASVALLACTGGPNSCTGGAGVGPIATTPGSALGVPTGQTISGGSQIRLTPTGIAKIGKKLFDAVPTTLCVAPGTINGGGLGTASYCDRKECSGGTPGCIGFLYKHSGDRPATASPAPPFDPPPPAAGHDDGKDKGTLTVADGDMPTITGTETLDFLVPLHVSYQLVGSPPNDCYLYAYSAHLVDDAATPVSVGVPLVPAIGRDSELAMTVGAVTIANDTPSLTGCGGLSSLLGPLVSSSQASIDAFIRDAVTKNANAVLQALLPKPPGVEVAIDLGPILTPRRAPQAIDYEIAFVAGGFANGSGGGLTTGVLAGANSDADPTTRDAPRASEPAACVAHDPPPDLAAAPFSLQGAPLFTLPFAPELGGAGTEPIASGGAPADLAVGFSRSYLRLLATHAARSGALCQTLDPTVTPAMTTGALSVLLDGTGAAYADRKAPLAIALKPPSALDVQIGAGTAEDPLVHVSAKHLALDFGFGSATPASRAFLVAGDLEARFDVGVTPTDGGNPGIELLFRSASMSNVSVTAAPGLDADPTHVTNLAAALAAPIAAIVAGPLTRPAALPAFDGSALDHVAITRLKAAADTFLSVNATIADTGAPAPPPARLIPTLRVASVDVPKQDALRALFDPAATGPHPTVTIDVGPPGAEYSVRIDGSSWRAWSADAHAVVADDAWLLQGHHSIEARARTPGDFRTESAKPAKVDVLVDSVPPELAPALDSAQTVVELHGFDLVSPDAALVYAYNDASGAMTPFSGNAMIAMADALAATHDGTTELVLFAKDEAGNVGTATFDLAKARGSGAADDGGCGCRTAGMARGSGLGAFALAVFACVARSARRHRRRPAMRRDES